MRILVITQRWYPDSFGGSEYIASEQARRLASRGHEVTVVTEETHNPPQSPLNLRGEEKRSYRNEKGIDIYRYGSEKQFARLAGASRAAVKEVPRILKGLTEIQSPLQRRLDLRTWDVAILHHPFPAYGFFRAKLNIPSLYVFHASTAREVMVDNTRRGPILTWFFAKWACYVEGMALRKADRVGVFSDFSQRILEKDYGFIASKIVRLRVGIDIGLRSTPTLCRGASQHILTVRRLWPRMGLLELLQAMELVIKQISDARLIIVGDGPMREVLEREIDQRGLREYVTLVGTVTTEALPRYYQAADLFVLPTQSYEGLGIATLEALVSGLPVVGTPVGATPEILGALDPTLVTRSPSTIDIANGILEFFSRPESEREQLRAKARQIAEQNYNWDRAIEQLETTLRTLRYDKKHHYEIEKELAGRLRSADKKDRQRLYTVLYDELFKRVPDHPQISLKDNQVLRQTIVARKMKLIKRFLKPDDVFMDVGAGDCATALTVAKQARQAYAIDVSNEITKQITFPKNVKLIISDGSSIPVPASSVQVAYSNQLMEHLHPDDAEDQLKNIYSALAPGGMYICITPNQLSGPHDISQYFSDEAEGFHLKEYTLTELAKLFKQVGFAKIKTYIGGKGLYLRFPSGLIMLCERILQGLPRVMSKRIARAFLIRALLGVIIVGIKI